MTEFKIHTIESGPPAARGTLETARQKSVSSLTPPLSGSLTLECAPPCILLSERIEIFDIPPRLSGKE